MFLIIVFAALFSKYCVSLPMTLAFYRDAFVLPNLIFIHPSFMNLIRFYAVLVIDIP